MDMEDEERRLQTSLEEQNGQLSSVVLSLSANIEDEETRSDLLDLRTKLEEVIELTKSELLDLKKKILLKSVLNIEENVHINGQTPTISGSVETDLSQSDLSSVFNSVENKKCRAPFYRLNGTIEYHNALIVCIEAIYADDFDVRCIFLHPVTKSMKPCKFYMNGGRCNLEEKCKFSHGHVVKYSQLKEFHEYDCSQITRDSKCLVKCSEDEIWREALVDHIDQDNLVTVKLIESDDILKADLDIIVPWYIESNSTKVDEDFEDENIDDRDYANYTSWNHLNLEAGALGEWEKYTKGIGSKLLKKMGYVWGQGLGKYCNGRLEPVEAVIVPQGKSLDVCMEFKERSKLRDPIKEKKKLARKKASVEAAIALGYQKAKADDDVFEFLNTKLARSSDKNKQEPRKKDPSKSFQESLKSTTSKNLNIKSLEAGEELKKAQTELHRLKESLERNKLRDKTTHSRLALKTQAQMDLITSLKAREKAIINEQQSRSTKKKSTIF